MQMNPRRYIDFKEKCLQWDANRKQVLVGLSRVGLGDQSGDCSIKFSDTEKIFMQVILATLESNVSDGVK